MFGLGALVGTVVGAGKGLVEGTVEGFETGCRGSIFDVITAPLGAVTGAVTGTTMGTAAGVAAVIKNPRNLVELNPMKCADDVCDVMDDSPWREEVVRPVARVTNTAAIGGAGAAVSVAGGALVGGPVGAIGAAAAFGAMRGLDENMTK